jgi:alkanesulfonate monooxygenase SsuD/methylene tetrahydromethanopterin reductase-like flavin-dependent oxidoreductase (luciferase family)
MIKIGVAFSYGQSIDELARSAELADNLGCDVCFVAGGTYDQFGALAICARATTRIRLQAVSRASSAAHP